MNSARRVLGLSVAAAFVVASASAMANTGQVTHISGTLSVKKSDGSIRILSQKSEIQSGDTMNTERDSYAQVKFSDGGQVTLKPNTSIKLEQFRFAQDRPQEDSFLLSLVKGGIRAVTGLVGQRNNDNYLIETSTGTVGIRGTTFSADDCTSDRTRDCGTVQPAVYVSVSDGEVVVRNPQGEVALTAGQFGLMERSRQPLLLSADPGLQFTPPATFVQAIMSGAAVNRKTVECAVSR